ncbi:MAG TPA: alpha-ketoglutarate-dependent dioxygenase AlkB, partial [Gemmataceae bacterium]|nr:alpha-ketoglutarate-dependent dioxygenase AlkB [Gemmataceae bacterium]
WDAERFEDVWNLHPAEKPVIHMPGGLVETPRWQQAFGADYHFSGQTSTAAPVPPVLEPLRDWSRGAIFSQLNGLLLNWYEGPGHYIGPHHDSTVDMIPDAPIVTISFGETRKFRLQRGTMKRDFEAAPGTVFVLPFATNRVWKHSVPKSTRYRGRRISVTIRAFASAA